jgi:hypothetical protein
MRFIVLICAAALIASAASATSYIDKEPDYGAWWHPLCNNNESYIYADTFTMTGGDDVVVTDLGMWLAAINYYGGSQHSMVTFEIWETSGGMPLFGTSLCSTDYVSSENTALTYIEAPVLSPVALTPGVMYAFVANAYHDFPGRDAYQVGGHTQGENPGYFFFSNYPGDGYFDGQFYTPEMAFKVTLNPIPEPGLIAPFAGLILGLGALLRRK